MKLNRFFIFILVVSHFIVGAQVPDSTSADFKKLVVASVDADSNYVLKYIRSNDVRVLYGAEGTSLAFGSTRKDDNINTAIYNNVNDLLGFGVTYKIIDVDLSFSLPRTKLLKEGQQNLEQFRLGMSFHSRNFNVRAFYTDSRGMISVDEGGEFKSQPNIRMLKVGAQILYYFNGKRYSYKAATFQSELQRKTAGSFLLKFEPFYQYVEALSGLVPQSRDLPAVYGDQVGLQTVSAPGFLVMPGYGINVSMANGKFFFSPLILVGPGLAINTYESQKGKLSSMNWEWSGALALNLGYNGTIAYANLRAIGDVYYIPLNPSYISTTSLKISLTVGYRFVNLEKFIPTKIF